MLLPMTYQLIKMLPDQFLVLSMIFKEDIYICEDMIHITQLTLQNLAFLSNEIFVYL